MEPIASAEKEELLALAIDKGDEHLDDLFSKVYEYLEGITIFFMVSEKDLEEIAHKACFEVETKLARAVERIENES